MTDHRKGIAEVRAELDRLLTGINVVILRVENGTATGNAMDAAQLAAELKKLVGVQP